MAQHVGKVAIKPPLAGNHSLRRRCACGQHTAGGVECADCREKKVKLQRAAIGSTAAGVAPPIVHDVLRSSGRPLDREVREFMEPRFGHDFSQMRVHTDARAAESARAVNALAYTVGNDVVFNAGRYAPTSASGRRLIAHELAHTIQQSSGVAGPQMQLEVDQDDNDALENDAVAAADQVVASADDSSVIANSPAKTKPSAPTKEPCMRNILAEGTCQHLATKSSWACCDPDNGFSRPGKTTSKAQPGKKCPAEKWSPLFTCDSTCDNALATGCDDSDNWMAIPGNAFSSKSCNDVYTICANGLQTQAYVRDKSEKPTEFEVSPGIQAALQVSVGASFKGAVYRPNTKQATIDKDPCCKTPQPSSLVPPDGTTNGDAQSPVAIV